MNATTIKWNASASRQVTAIARPKWKELRWGLSMSLVGQPLALTSGLAGLYLVATMGGPLGARLDVSPDDAVLIGWTLTGGSLLGYALLLAGQWRCLVSAPQGCGAKDLQYACLLCTFAAPLCFAGGHYLGGEATYEALEQGPRELLRLGLLGGGPLLQLVGLAMALGGVLLASAFARALCRFLKNADAARGVTCYFWFVAFLLGATVGLFTQTGRHTPQGVLPLLALAWLICLLWHSLLLQGAGRLIGRILRGERPAGAPPEPVSTVQPGQVVLKAADYLYGAKKVSK
jgi:hypothetical protein